MAALIRSFRNAYNGLLFCFKTQRNMVIHVIIGAVVLLSAYLFRVSMIEMMFLLAAVTVVLVAETFNTAIEKMIDMYTKKRNRLAHIAKDAAAGAVLLTSLFAVVIGIIILGPPLWQFIVNIIF